MKTKYIAIVLILAVIVAVETVLAYAAFKPEEEQTTTIASTTQKTTSVLKEEDIPEPYYVKEYTEFTYEVVNEYPHFSNAFTQGLVFEDGFLYEGTGLNGESTLRKVNFSTGEVLQKIDLDDDYFGEGITILGDKIYQLTWQSKIGFVYEKATFNKIDEFNYHTEGWGLAHDGTNLILSDGSSSIYFISPDNFEIVRKIDVYDKNGPIDMLNELEYIYGNIFANVWQTDQIVIINSLNGTLMGQIDLTGLLKATDRTPETDVLNGIAYDQENNRLFVTGKKWPKVFEIKLIPTD